MIDWETLDRWENDWLKIRQGALEERRAFLEGVLCDDWARLTQAIQWVRYGHEWLVINWAFGLADQLDPESSVATTPHLDRLLRLAAKVTLGENLPPLHRWFDAVSTFDQAVALAKIEQEDPLEGVGRDMDRLIDFLGDRLFTGDFETVEFYVYHDPEHDFTVAEGDIGIGRHLSHRAVGRTRRKARLTCRRVRENGLVYLHHRLKNQFRTYLKIHRQRLLARESPTLVRDRCGLMFVLETVEDALAFAERVREVLVEDGAVVTETPKPNFHVDRPGDPDNKESSKAYKVAKTCLRWRGREVELQFCTFANHFSARLAVSDVNHELYKLGQAFKHFFPWLWPQEVYGINWSNGHVRTQMHAWKVAQLGWRVNGDVP